MQLCAVLSALSVGQLCSLVFGLDGQSSNKNYVEENFALVKCALTK
jgi:hypothetical protein